MFKDVWKSRPTQQSKRGDKMSQVDLKLSFGGGTLNFCLLIPSIKRDFLSAEMFMGGFYFLFLIGDTLSKEERKDVQPHPHPAPAVPLGT